MAKKTLSYITRKSNKVTLYYNIMEKKLLKSLFGNYYSKAAINYRQAQTYCYSILHPYHYDAKRYSNTFLEKPCEFEYSDDLKKHIDRVIYIFWTGDNDITPNRLEGIKSLENVSGVEVKLITPKNLPDYIKEDDPIPDAYQYLSLNHRSDYLRSYFMYHYGGGYADIKLHTHSWVRTFEKFEESDAFIASYPEVGFWGADFPYMTNEEIKRDVYNHWRLLVGNCAFICRPHTIFVAEWHTAVKNRLLAYTDQLREHPAKDFFGRNIDYPIPWANLQGAIFHPFCLKYHDRLLKDKALMPSFKNYR